MNVYEVWADAELVEEFDTEEEAVSKAAEYEQPAEVIVRPLNAFEDVQFSEVLDLIGKCEAETSLTAVARIMRTPAVTLRKWRERKTGRVKATQKLRLLRFAALLGV